MKKAVMFVAIAVATAAVGLAISAPRSPENPAPASQASADVAVSADEVMPKKAPDEYVPPDFSYSRSSSSSKHANDNLRAASGFNYSSRPLRSGCSGGSCCPK